jgi:putative endonuclease
MKGKRGSLGKLGEDEACRFLEDKGHTILARNWRTGHLEIDIITLSGDGLHFVEVKSRTAPVEASPEENVGLMKQRNIAQAAARYLAEAGFGDMEAWLDVVAVVFEGGETRIQYFPDAYVPIDF